MKKLTLLYLFLISSVALAQQAVQVKGVVTSSSDGLPLPGASVFIEELSKGTTTDFNGVYQLEANEGDILVFSYIGYRQAKLTVGATSTYDIELIEDVNELDAVVVTGYSTEKKKDITGAITVVDVDELDAVATPNVISKLQSRVPGLSLTSSGSPGGNDTQISIRGLTSVFGGTGPLWVIDGVQTSSPAGLNPNDIESIQVLKDAASAGIYGTEAARGVIVVTTKQAKSGTSKITLDSRVTLNTIREDFSVLGAQDWLDVRYRAQGNTPVVAGNFVYTPGTPLSQFIDAENNLRTSNTNWVNEITKNSLSTTTDFGYSFATDKWKIFTGLGYAKDEGVIARTFYDRATLRLNASVKLFKDRVTIGENLTVANFREVKINPMEDALLQNPLIPVFAEDGTYGGPTGAGLQDKWNPLAILFINRNNVEKTWRTFGNVYADINIVDGLTLSSKFNFDHNSYKYDENTESFNQNGSILGNIFIDNGQNFERFARNRNISDTYIFTNLLRFNKELGNHSLNAFAGHETFRKVQDNDFKRIQVAQGTQVDFDNIEQYDIIADNTILDAYGIGADSKRESMFAKLSYDYSDKYYASASIRRDGSSRFGRNNRYGIFPTASLGWTISQEGFMQDSKVFNNLKLRASWGGNGNADILEYAQYSIYQAAVENSNYDLAGGGTGPIDLGVSPNQVGNPDLKWEQSYQTNLGLDANLFNNRINLVVDVYEKVTSDLLLQTIQPSVLGEAGSTLFFNAGDMTNKGIDIVLGYSSKRKNDFNFGLDFTFSAYENEVTGLNGTDNFILQGVSYTGAGQPIGSYFGYVADGLFRTPEEVAVHAEQPGKGLGNIRYRDLNGDGVVNQDDRTIIGNPHPDFIYGINFSSSYKNWDFGLFFDGRQGNDMYNQQRELLDLPYFGFNHGLNTLDAWSPSNANTTIPALSTADTNDQKRPSTYFVEDGSFFRLKNVNLAYNFNTESLNKLGIKRAKVYIQAENLINITSFTGFDYEVPGLSRTGIGIANMAVYPHTKTYSFGFNLQF